MSTIIKDMEQEQHLRLKNQFPLARYKLSNDWGFWNLDVSENGDWYRVSDVEKLYQRINELEEVITKLRLRCEFAESQNTGQPENSGHKKSGHGSEQGN